jgi:hypothetical protein
MSLAAAALPPALQGFVEAMGPERVLGWAWQPHSPEARLAVELREGTTVLARGVADQPRPDLAQNGVGDGAHAFAFPLDAGMQARAAALRVVAIAADGTELELGAPPAAPAASDGGRTLESLVASQRVLHRNLQAVLLAVKAREPEAALLDGIAEAQEALRARTAELERFVLRLDERLARLDEARAPAAKASRRGLVALGVTLAVAALAFAASFRHVLG